MCKWHRKITDWLIEQGGIGFSNRWEQLAAEHFEVTPAWIAMVTGADGFKDYYYRHTKDLKVRRPTDEGVILKWLQEAGSHADWLQEAGSLADELKDSYPEIDVVVGGVTVGVHVTRGDRREYECMTYGELERAKSNPLLPLIDELVDKVRPPA
jgi:hypothetical protein